MITTGTHTSTLANEIADLVNDELNSYDLTANVQSVSGDYPWPWAGVEYSTSRHGGRKVRIVEDDGQITIVVSTWKGSEQGRATFNHMPAGIISPVATAYLI